ncbi:MAG: LemA family protein [Anaeroplasmataceae bacterium]|nr:LemA family protein [Anaeroplasmataceae bacterium]MDE6414417.1 LemA family protein [Anaeroplasmataceae bacterium]
MSTPVIIVLVVIGVILLLVLCVVGWVISTRNKFIRMEQDVENSESRIDVYLTKRFDLLTKMLDTTKGYMKHERETLIEVIQMRNPGVNASLKEKANFNEQLTTASRNIRMVAERYPELKADRMFNNLQQAQSEVEENLQAARSNYNANVASFNKAILQFPASIVAGSRFPKKDYFEAEEQKRQDIKMEF